ncbi:MAG: hypothetical protein NT075_26330 [Chloroflexi bacterium]|nr:hypothetical protein [Chloroflexota bacterium]
MPITRYVTCAVIFANTSLPPNLKESGSDAAIQLIESASTPQPQFTLYGYARNHALSLPDLEQHPQYDAVSQAVTWVADLSSAENIRLITLVDAVSAPTPVNVIPGTDGIWYDLTIERTKNRSHFRWWTRPPVGWESAGALVNYMLELSQSTFILSAQRSASDKANKIAYTPKTQSL